MCFQSIGEIKQVFYYQRRDLTSRDKEVFPILRSKVVLRLRWGVKNSVYDITSLSSHPSQFPCWSFPLSGLSLLSLFGNEGDTSLPDPIVTLLDTVTSGLSRPQCLLPSELPSMSGSPGVREVCEDSSLLLLFVPGVDREEDGGPQRVTGFSDLWSTIH